jgi:hypothetical protein
MTTIFSRRLVRALLGSMTATLALTFARPSFGNSGSGLIGDQPRRITNTCFWKVPIRPDTDNVLALDTNVTYSYTSYHLPPGDHVVLHGKFPHSRFMSLTSYTGIGGQAGFPTTSLTDIEINPDPRASNPFRSGTSRTGHRRSYTITLSGDADPGVGNRAPNTLYTGQVGQTATTQFVEVIYRIYRPDERYDLSGGVGLPKAMLVHADRSTATGQTVCDELQVVSGAGSPIPAFGAPIGFPEAQYDAVLALGPPTHPAVQPIVWDRFFNPKRLAEPFFRGTVLQSQIATLPTALTSGLYATPANAYVVGYASRLLGPDPGGHNVLVLHAKLPTHPSTFARDRVNDSAGKQVRYWSLCNYGALVVEIGTGPVLMDGCLFDEQVPTDADGFYTVVVSLPEDRPANATAQCGVAWLDWGKGDWLARPDLATLIMRNQLSDPSFVEGIDKVLTPETEPQVMGDYYPTSRYLTPAQFEARGCPGTGSPSGAFIDR